MDNGLDVFVCVLLGIFLAVIIFIAGHFFGVMRNETASYEKGFKYGCEVMKEVYYPYYLDTVENYIEEFQR